MIIIALLFSAATIFIACSCFCYELGSMNSMDAFRCGVFLMEALVLDLSMVSTASEKRHRDTSQKFLFAIQALGAIDLLSDVFVYFSDASYQFTTVILVLILWVSPLNCMLFWFYQQSVCEGIKDGQKALNTGIILMCGLDCLFIVLGTVLGKMFTLDSDLTYHIGPWNKFTYIYPFMVLVYSIIYNIRCKTTARKHIICIVYAALPILLALLALLTGNTIFSHSATMFGVLIIFAGIQANRNYENLMRERQLQESTLNAAILQINPHFIQNCLTSIRDLMYMDMKTADTMIVDLAGYLRETYSSLNRNEMITVHEEMKLVDFYLGIEAVRFPDMLRVERQIELPDFLIPAFIIEPLVENAVRHGIREKGAAGCIEIRVIDMGASVEIRVIDDGVGFDMNAIPEDGRKHVGLQNVRTRIALMTKGVFSIESRPGYGTKIVISLPKEESLK